MVKKYQKLNKEGFMDKVIIHVRGGVAEVAVCPPNVEVEIKDFDDLEAEAQ
jgi:hypothetical protein